MSSTNIVSSLIRIQLIQQDMLNFIGLCKHVMMLTRIFNIKYGFVVLLISRKYMVPIIEVKNWFIKVKMKTMRVIWPLIIEQCILQIHSYTGRSMIRRLQVDKGFTHELCFTAITITINSKKTRIEIRWKSWTVLK